MIKNVIDAILDIPRDADTRDTTAVKRIASAYVKLLFPAWDSVEKVDVEQFEKYCLKPAVKMRGIIRRQLEIMDTEYRKKPMAEYRVKAE